MDAIVDACRWIEDNMGKRVRVIGLDYLNQIPVRGRGPRREEVMDIVKDAKNMALAMGCPVILGVQAKREVDERKIPIPEMGDGMETSNIEHTADKIFTVWMPKVTHQQGDLIDVGGTALTVSDNMLVVKLAKQRYGKAGKLMFLHIDPATSTIQGAYSSVNIDDLSREVMDAESKKKEGQEAVQSKF
jgi:replicative DNA helicase